MTFSVTIIALQLTSTQFSPRVLRNFMRDRTNQSVLAAFLGTFAYCVMVLASVRTAAEGDQPFVPVPALAGAVALTLLSLGMLVYFIHHIAHTIQVSAITDSVARETRETIQRLWQAADSAADGAEGDAGPEAEAVLEARESGYLVYAAHDPLLDVAEDADATIRVHASPGEWVAAGRPLVAVSPPAAVHRLRKDPREHVKLGPQPTLQQDVAFGVRQLVDIALKALSPSLNDPTTAVNCIHRLTELLLEVGRRREPVTLRTGESGKGRLLTPLHDFVELVALSFDQVRDFGGERLYVALAMCRAFETLIDDLPAHRHPPVLDQAHLLQVTVKSIEPAGDRRRVTDLLRAVVAAAERRAS